MLTIAVPTLNDRQMDFDWLFRLWRGLSRSGASVRFTFSGCRFLRQNAVAFLGGLARLIEYRGGHVEFAWDTLADDVAKNLAKNGFMVAFGQQRPFLRWWGNSIPYREDHNQAAHDYQNYLSQQWLGRGWMNVTSGLRDAIVGRVAEAYLNAFEPYTRSPIGVFTCGQYFPNVKELNLTMVDFGVGIPSNVRFYHAGRMAPEQLGAAKCMQWAFQAGTSTKPPSEQGGGPHGLGLDLLQAFVRINRGKLEMFSHEGYALVQSGVTIFDERPTFFEGTLVNISLRCDESYYCLASEAGAEPPF